MAGADGGCEAIVQADGRAALVAALIAATAATAGVVFGVVAAGGAHAIAHRPVAFAGLLLSACVLQLKVIQVPEDGSVSFAVIGVLGAALYLGTAAAMVVAAATAIVRFASSAGRADRAIFDTVHLALAAAIATGTFHLAEALDRQPNDRFGPSVFAAALFYVANTGLLSLAMGLDEGQRPFQVWKRRFRWLAPWTLAAGPYAQLMVSLYGQVGIVGIVGTALMPLVLVAPIQRTYWTSG